MEKRFLISILLLTFVFSISAQADEEIMFDSFEEISCDEMIARLDNLQIALGNEPYSTAFIIVYEGKHRDFSAGKKRYILPRFGDSVARTKTMRERLIFSKYDLKSFNLLTRAFVKNTLLNSGLCLKVQFRRNQLRHLRQ